jgi:hypothetical protein
MARIFHIALSKPWEKMNGFAKNRHIRLDGFEKGVQ